MAKANATLVATNEPCPRLDAWKANQRDEV
jgi:hypothetical protein